MMMAERCLFVEVPVAGTPNRCPEEPVYKLWADGCEACAEAGLRMGIRNMDCVGHWACIQHGAEARAGKFDVPGGGGITVRRIQSIGVPGA
jgi:hypothetical protein